MTLQRLRRARGLRQKTLANGIGIDPSYLSSLETGRKAPPANPEFYDRLRAYLQLSEEELKELRHFGEAGRSLGQLPERVSPPQLDLLL